MFDDDSVPLCREDTLGEIPQIRDEASYTHVEKVWGNEVWVINTPYYCGKILTVGRDHHTSMHFHGVKHETMFCTKGSFRIDFIDPRGDVVARTLTPGESIVIPPLLPHSIHGLEDKNELIEFSTQHFDTDSYRVGKPG
jgi:D-lyxose ketol-isomerase